MKNKFKPTFGYIITTLALATFAAGVLLADTQNIPFTVSAGGGNNNSCPGGYTGYAKITNSAGSIWLSPPTNATSGTFTDASGFAPPYVSAAVATRKNDLMTWCGTNSVTFPVTNTAKYSLTVYVKSTVPPPTNGQPLNLQVTWH